MTNPPSMRWRGAGPAARTGLLAAALGVMLLPGAAAQAASPEGVTLSDARMRTVIPSRPAAGYFTLKNDSGKAVALVGAKSPACGTLMLHQSLHEGGQDRMVMVKRIAVPAHGSLKFAPGGYHLMCMSPSKDVTPGGSVSVTLRFEDGSTISAPFPVHGMGRK